MLRAFLHRIGSPKPAPLRLALAGVLLICGCQPAPERVVLVSIDTLRADHVGCYGAPARATPTIDAIAAAGVRFEVAISPAPLTLPSHATLLTGMDPPRHGVHNNGTFRLGDDVPLLQEALREEGFETGAFVGAVVLDRQYGLARGFDHYDDRIGLRRAGEFGYAERRAAEVVRAAREWVARTDGRFFLWVHLFDPHADYDPPPPARKAFADPYLAEIAYADAQLARLLNDIRLRWPEGDTLLVVTSDHGESRGEHGEGGHSYTLYDVTQRIPLVMAGPGLPRGKVVSSPVRLSDVAPTILRMVGRTPPPGLDGRDLRPLWEGEAGEERSAYLETLAPRLDMGWSALYGLRSSRFKYLRAPRPELYDLENDPRELRNLASQRPELVKELDTALSARLEEARPVESNLVVDELRRAQIESLGYVVADSVDEVELGSVGGLDPKDGLAQLTSWGTALALLDEGRPDEALEGLLAVEEGGLLLELLRADAAVRAGRPELAERFALAARELAGGEHPDVVLALADAYQAQGRWDEAEALFRAEAERDAAAWLPGDGARPHCRGTGGTRAGGAPVSRGRGAPRQQPRIRLAPGGAADRGRRGRGGGRPAGPPGGARALAARRRGASGAGRAARRPDRARRLPPPRRTPRRPARHQAPGAARGALRGPAERFRLAGSCEGLLGVAQRTKALEIFGG